MTALQCFNSAILQRCEARFNFAIRALRLFSRRMPQFSYRARNAQGGLVEGVLDCPDRVVAFRQIEQMQYVTVRMDVVVSEPLTVLQESGKEAASVVPRPANPLDQDAATHKTKTAPLK